MLATIRLMPASPVAQILRMRERFCARQWPFPAKLLLAPAHAMSRTLSATTSKTRGPAPYAAARAALYFGPEQQRDLLHAQHHRQPPRLGHDGEPDADVANRQNDRPADALTAASADRSSDQKWRRHCYASHKQFRLTRRRGACVSAAESFAHALAAMSCVWWQVVAQIASRECRPVLRKRSAIPPLW